MLETRGCRERLCPDRQSGRLLRGDTAMAPRKGAFAEWRGVAFRSFVSLIPCGGSGLGAASSGATTGPRAGAQESN